MLPIQRHFQLKRLKQDNMAIPKLSTPPQSKAITSTANWQYNQAGYTYDRVGLEYGGADRAQDLGPQYLSVYTEKPNISGVVIE
jgi:hypothetical protein